MFGIVKCEKMSVRPSQSTELLPRAAEGGLSRLVEVLTIGVKEKKKKKVARIVLPKVEAPRLEIFMPTALSNPEFNDALWSEEQQTKLIKMVLEEAVVLGSFSGSWLLRSVGDGTPYEKGAAWFKFMAGSSLEYVSKGAFNKAFFIDPEDTPIMFRLIFGDALRKFMWRTSNEGKYPTAQSAILEIILTGYAAASRLGPKLYGATMVPETLKEDAIALSTVKLHVFSEAWNGNLHLPILNREMPPDIFARLFVELLGRAKDAGFFHLDLKPPNMLYRGNGESLELCFTDFDREFCMVFPPATRERYGKCNVLVHATMFMGYVSCIQGAEVWAFYVDAVREALKAMLNISLDDVDNDELNAFFDEVVSKRTFRNSPEPANEKPRVWVAENWRDSMENYLHNAKFATLPSKRCLVHESFDDPLFTQFMRFALENQERVNELIEKSTEPDENGVYPILDNLELWKIYRYGYDSRGVPIITDPKDQQELADGFHSAYMSGNEDLFQDWYDDIPSEAELRFGDIHSIKVEGNSIPVLEPQEYRSVKTLDRDHMMFGDDSLYGYFYPANIRGKAAENDAYEKSYNPEHFRERATSRAGDFFKMHPALLQHVRAWPVWGER